MKVVLVVGLLSTSVILAALTAFTSLPRRMVLGWLGVGLCQSFFLLVIGFEFLCLLNLLFVVASATVLQIYSALFGTAAIFASERTRARSDWIYGIGTGATVASILAFSLVGTFPEATIVPDLDTPLFAKAILTSFPELPWILGVVLFLMVVASAVVGRPGWRRTSGRSE